MNQNAISIGLSRWLAMVVLGAAAALAQDPCATIPPNVSLTLGPKLHSVQANNSAPSISNGPPVMSTCHYWVADITVPSNSSGTGTDLPQFLIETASIFVYPGSDGCSGWTEESAIYRKHVNGQFSKIGGGLRKSQLVGAKDEPKLCLLLPTVPGVEEHFSPPAAGTSVYRVASRLSYKGQNKTESVQAVHVMVPIVP
jgi:hypothetical protein